MRKVLLVGEFSPHGIASSYSKGFKYNDCEVINFDEYGHLSSLSKNKYINRLFWKLFALKVNNNLIKKIKEENPDIILIFKGFFIHPKTLKKIKGLNPEIKLFNFNPDNPFNTRHFSNSNSWILKSIPLYDTYFIWGKFLLQPLKEAGAQHVRYLAFAHNPELHYPIEPEGKEIRKYKSPVTFIGTWDKEREWWLNKLYGYSVSIWGNSWEKGGRYVQRMWKQKPVFREEYSKICNSSNIVLNFTRKQNGDAHDMRTFEIPACGGFMLTTRTKEQLDFFEEGKEIACFSTPEELREKIDYYLDHPKERKKIAEAAHKKVQKHTYYERTKQILRVYEELFLS